MRTATIDMICLPGMEADVPFGVPPKLERIARVDTALAADGLCDDEIDGWVRTAAKRLGCAATLASVAAELWGTVPAADEALYLLAEVAADVAEGSFKVTSPRAHRVARCHRLVACTESPSLAGVADAGGYITAAAHELGVDVSSGAQSLGAAQSLADVVETFIATAVQLTA